MFSRIAFAAAAASLATPSIARAQSVADFYRGKTVTVLIGVSAGGEYDLQARLVARHIGKHIPGNPTVVAQNMPGAAGATAAYYVTAVAPKDGTVLGAIHPGNIIEPVLGDHVVHREHALAMHHEPRERCRERHDADEEREEHQPVHLHVTVRTEHARTLVQRTPQHHAEVHEWNFQHSEKSEDRTALGALVMRAAETTHGEIAEIGEGGVARVQELQLHGLVGRDVVDHLDADRAAILETVRTGASGIGRGERILRV